MKFSIITCTLNSRRFLESNISTVSSQTFKNYEHIFIDGYSADGTLDIIKNYQTSNPAAVKLIQRTPAGIAHAMNEGIKHAVGDYLLHLHSDDRFYDECVLQDVSDYLERDNDLDWIYGKANVIEEDGKSIGLFPDRTMLQYDSQNWFGRYFLKFFNYIPHQAVFIRRSVFEKFGCFDEKIRIEMDYDMWLRIKDNTKWSFFNRVICDYMVRAGAQSSSLAHKRDVINDHEGIQKRHMNFLEFSAAKQFNSFVRLFNKTYR